MVHTVCGFMALTASLCSASLLGAVKRTRRIGTLNSRATLTQYARVSMSALVLSVMHCELGVRLQGPSAMSGGRWVKRVRRSKVGQEGGEERG